MIKKIVIELDKKEISLTENEARTLYQQLRGLFDNHFCNHWHYSWPSGQIVYPTQTYTTGNLQQLQ